MSATSTKPLQHGTVALQQPRLECGERHRAIGLHGVAGGLPAVGVDARGDVDGQHDRVQRDPGRVIGTAEPGAVGAVDDEVARRERVPAPHVGGLDTWTRAPRQARKDAATRPSAPLLPLPATTTTRRP